MKLPPNDVSPELLKKIREKYSPPKPPPKPPRPVRVVKGGGKGK
jgi:hypothetical protein